MITIVEGNLGSGKSFYAVNYLVEHFCTYDKMYDEFLLKDSCMVISNVEGLRVKHLNLIEQIEKYTAEVFFTVENFEKIQKQYKVKTIILIIDEAQKIFDSKYFNKDVFYLFQYSRHLGLDVFFLTQSRATIARHLIPLCEYVIFAKPRSKGIKGVFSYNFIDPKGTYLYNRTIRAKEIVFRAYKSFRVDEATKPRSVLMYYVILVSIVAVITFGLFKYMFSYFKVDTAKTAKKVTYPMLPAPVPAFKNSSSHSSPVAGGVNPKKLKKISIEHKIVSVAPGQIKTIPKIEKKPEWIIMKVSAFVQTATGLRLYSGEQELTNYKDFDSSAMIAMVRVADKRID